MATPAAIDRYAPYARAALRVVTALLFMQHGFQKVFFWPASEFVRPPFVLLSMNGVAGILELVGGLLILLGLFTRPTAFILAGQMAVAYWMFHFGMTGANLPDGWMPVVNGGDAAILYCFIFLYLVFAGPGRPALDNMRAGRRSSVDTSGAN